MFHSATKYLAGHSDTVVGVAVTSDDAIAERLRFLQNAMGGVPGPLDCFLVLRGLRTLHLRVERHAANAAAVAAFLAGRDDVAQVTYPGLAGSPRPPRAATAARQMRPAAAWSRSSPPPGAAARARAGRRDLRGDAALHAGGVAGRRRIPDRAARPR